MCDGAGRMAYMGEGKGVKLCLLSLPVVVHSPSIGHGLEAPDEKTSCVGWIPIIWGLACGEFCIRDPYRLFLAFLGCGV
jgi:hypothetical protein